MKAIRPHRPKRVSTSWVDAWPRPAAKRASLAYKSSRNAGGAETTHPPALGAAGAVAPVGSPALLGGLAAEVWAALAAGVEVVGDAGAERPDGLLRASRSGAVGGVAGQVDLDVVGAGGVLERGRGLELGPGAQRKSAPIQRC